MAGAAAEQIDVSLNVIWREGDPIHHRVKGVTGQRRLGAGAVADVTEQHRRANGRGPVDRLAAIKQVEIDALAHCQFAAGRADNARTADKQYFHRDTSRNAATIARMFSGGTSA